MRACVRAFVYACAFAAWTRGGPAPPGLGLNSHVRSDDPASQACWPAKGILYLAMTRTRHEEAISPRRGSSREAEGEGRERRETAGERLGCATRMRQKVEDVRDGERGTSEQASGRTSEGEHRRRRFNQRGYRHQSFLSRGFQPSSSRVGVGWKLVKTLPQIRDLYPRATILRTVLHSARMRLGIAVVLEKRKKATIVTRMPRPGEPCVMTK